MIIAIFHLLGTMFLFTTKLNILLKYLMAFLSKFFYVQYREVIRTTRYIFKLLIAFRVFSPVISISSLSTLFQPSILIILSSLPAVFTAAHQSSRKEWPRSTSRPPTRIGCTAKDSPHTQTVSHLSIMYETSLSNAARTCKNFSQSRQNFRKINRYFCTYRRISSCKFHLSKRIVWKR